jgi:hypothetical protein
MKALRWRLRLAVTSWLLFQVVSLSALVPLACCDAHRPANAVRRERCHETAESPYCPMRARDGKACPMHQQAEADASHAHHRQMASEENASHHGRLPDAGSATESPNNQCAIGGTCTAPMTALAVILSNHGVVPDNVGILSNADRTVIPQHNDEHLTSRQDRPDSPPPRA